MSIEEKAKAYDEALEKARMYRDNAKAVEEYSAVARYENIFPQLRESEDERIRKELIEFIKSLLCNDAFDRYKLRSWIVWLEKQKEQKSTSFNEPYNPDDYEVVMEGNATSLKRKEQKPADHCSVRDEFDLDGNLKQKYAEWSEENERMLERAIHIIVEYSDIDEKESEIVQNWLKSLRPSWKPSEELLDALYIVAYLPELEFYGGLKDKIRELYKRLKKL